MVTLNLKDGSTLKLDLSKDADRERFNFLGQALSSKNNSEIVTGLWLLAEGQPAVTLPLPKRFRRVFFYVEPLMKRESDELMGEVIRLQADDVCLVVTRYYREGGKMVRVDLQHTGKPRYSPGGMI